MSELTKEILTEEQKADFTEMAGSLQKLPLQVKERIYFMIRGAELVDEQPDQPQPDKTA